MNWNQRVRATVLSGGHEVDDDVIEELAQHARAMYEAGRADGLSRAEADRQVSDQLNRWRSDAETLRHEPRRPPVVPPPAAAAPAACVSPWLAGLPQDLRYSARLLRRQPRATLLAILTMALGIGATTVLFSVTYGVLMKPLPWPQADRLVRLKETRGGHAPRFNSFSNAAYLAWREETTTIESIAAWSQRTVTLSGAGDPDRIRVTAASASLFAVLGARPLIGSLFGDGDELSGSGSVVVLAESLWRERFGADTNVLGRVVQLDGQPHTIVGVLPASLSYPDRRSLAWVPFHVPPAGGNYLSMFEAIARLRHGATAAQAASEGTARGRFAADTGMTTIAIFGGSGPVAISAVTLKDAVTADVRPAIIVLLGAVVLLLLTATANVAGLQLARAAARRREMAIRAALGAGSARVVRQLLTESLLLGLAGGGAGLALAALLYRAIPAVLPADFPRADDLGLDAIVIAFAVGVSVLTSLIFGLLPALAARRLDLAGFLNDEGTAPAGIAGPSRAGQIRTILMASQVATACVLLIGASLLGRSFLALVHADRGYDPSGVLTARLSLPGSMYTPERRYLMVRGIVDRLASMPAVVDASFTSELPLTAGGSTSAFTLRDSRGVQSVQASPRIVGPGAFAALGMHIAEGRSFNELDTEASLPVVIVNRTFVRRYLAGPVLGAKLPMGAGYRRDNIDATVVGVVDDVRYLAAGEAPQPEMYYSFRQFSRQLVVPVVTLLVRTADDPASLGPALRSAVRDVDRTLVPEAIMTMEDRQLAGLAQPRLYSMLLGGFASLALLVAAVGLYGVLAQTVAQRSREIAVRSALGATPSDLVRLVVGQGLAITAAGVFAGMGVAAVLARSMAAFLYGVTPHDGMTFVGVPLLLLAVAGIACFVPGRRAAQMDPVKVLRSK